MDDPGLGPIDQRWVDGFTRDVQFGYLEGTVNSPKRHHPQLVVNAEDGNVFHTLTHELRRSRSFTFSVAFITPAAIAQLKQHLFDFQGQGTIITSTYQQFNSPEVFAELRILQERGIDVRLHGASAYHPKGYVFIHGDTSLTALIGSSNLTSGALVSNHEWNLQVSVAPGSDLARQLESAVADEHAESSPLTTEWVEEYARTWLAPASRSADVRPDDPNGPLQPNAMQRDALAQLSLTRANGEPRAVIISATGTGKTLLSAFDVRAADPRQLLFVVHREQILDKAMVEYRRVLGGSATDYGKLSGGTSQSERRYVFASVQTLAQPDVLASLAPDRFDYIVIDEAHRIAAPTYRRVIDHFFPRFLLGMTATPERTDGANIFELFNYVVPYEIRLSQALDEGMLVPFHYYGIADVAEAPELVSGERVDHLVQALADYGQAGVAPRGLIFCSRNHEALSLAAALTGRDVRGRTLRVAAVSGDHTIAEREQLVRQLEANELDYLVTVDVFNEGIDIPSVNQVVLLRQTTSPIVFVQQLGRGLRKAPDKDYLVVIDMIGNYAANYMIPMALFGDQSLNKESVRKELAGAEGSGTMPGLASVSFDEVSRRRVLDAIAKATLDSLQNLRSAMRLIADRVGGVPQLFDFHRFASVDPVLLATKKEHYPALVKSLLGVDHGLTEQQSNALRQLSHEVMPAKRMHEFVVLQGLLSNAELSLGDIATLLSSHDLPFSRRHIASAIDTLTLETFSSRDRDRYGQAVAQRTDTGVRLADAFVEDLARSSTFADAVDDLVTTGRMIAENYPAGQPFARGRQYSRKEVTRLLNLPRSWDRTLYGYKVDREGGTCPIFVTLHKADDVSASTAYEDALVDSATMRWYTRSRRRLNSPEVRDILSGEIDLHIFAKKDDSEGINFYYLGQAQAREAEQSTIGSPTGEQLDVVRMLLGFDRPLPMNLLDYLTDPG